jgi:hypothetical protein
MRRAGVLVAMVLIAQYFAIEAQAGHCDASAYTDPPIFKQASWWVPVHINAGECRLSDCSGDLFADVTFQGTDGVTYVQQFQHSYDVRWEQTERDYTWMIGFPQQAFHKIQEVTDFRITDVTCRVN